MLSPLSFSSLLLLLLVDCSSCYRFESSFSSPGARPFQCRQGAGFSQSMQRRARQGSTTPFSGRDMADVALEQENASKDSVTVGEVAPFAETSIFNEGTITLPLIAFNTIGKSTRWTVALSVAAALVIFRDPFTLAMVIGAVSNAFLSKLLKKVINQSRPEAAKSVKESSGMPSSHAMSLFFFTSFLSVASKGGANWCPFSPIAVSIFLFSYAIIASSWRVHSRLHTMPQIVVGASIGSCTGFCWATLFQSQVASILHSLFGPVIPVPVLGFILTLAAFSIGFFQKRLKVLISKIVE